MMMRLALVVAFSASLTTQPAFATPGQTEKQLAAWGKSVAALHGFHASIDDETGGTDYTATIAVDGLTGDYSSEPSKGVVPMEYVSFQNTPDSWNVENHPQLMRDALRAIYGGNIEADFEHAAKVPLHGRVVAWQGKKLVYATLGAALFTIGYADWPAVLKNIHSCDAILCED